MNHCVAGTAYSMKTELSDQRRKHLSTLKICEKFQILIPMVFLPYEHVIAGDRVIIGLGIPDFILNHKKGNICSFVGEKNPGNNIYNLAKSTS